MQKTKHRCIQKKQLAMKQAEVKQQAQATKKPTTSAKHGQRSDEWLAQAKIEMWTHTTQAEVRSSDVKLEAILTFRRDRPLWSLGCSCLFAFSPNYISLIFVTRKIVIRQWKRSPMRFNHQLLANTYI